MYSLRLAGKNRRVYRMKVWQKGLYLSMGAVFAVGGVTFGMGTAACAERAVGAAITLPFVALGAYLFTWALRSKLVIDGESIEVHYAIRMRSADLSEIEGFRTMASQYGSYRLLCLRDGQGTISITQSFDTDERFRAWFEQLVDLDARDRQSMLDKISQQENLGPTREKRLIALDNAKRWSLALTAGAIAAAAALNLAPAVFLLPSALALALAPAVAVALMHRAPLLYAVFKRKADPRAELVFVLIAAGLGLVLRGNRVEFVSLLSLVPLIAALGVAYFSALFHAALKGSSAWGVMLGILLLSALNSYGLAIVADTLTDRSRPSVYFVPVTAKQTSTGHSTTYYLDLKPWGPVHDPNRVSVSSRLYGEVLPGERVCVGLHPGKLNAPWYHLVACPALSTSN